MNATQTKLEPFKFTKEYRKDFYGKFSKIHRLARMRSKLIVKADKAAQKRGA